MNYYPTLRLLGGVCLAALLAACSTVDQTATEAPAEPSTSVAQAEGRLAAVAAERAAIEARFADRQAVCYDKFFVNRCLDQANERRRVALLAQRAIEIEAERYLRRSKVEERDRAMAEAEAAYQKEEAELAANPPATKQVEPTPPPRATTQSRSKGRAQENAARSEDDAAKRAANVAAYEERKRKSEERQKEVARRVAEREAKAARQAAQEAAKANGTATPAPAPTSGQ